MNRSLRRGAVAVAVALAVSPFAAACGTGTEAASVLTRPDNPEASLGDLRIQDVVVVLDKDDPKRAALNAVITNTGTQPERLTGIALTGPAGTAAASLRPAANPAAGPHGLTGPAPLASTPPAAGAPGAVVPGGGEGVPVPSAASPGGPPVGTASPQNPSTPSPTGAPSATGSPSPTATGGAGGGGGELTAPANGGGLFIGMPGAAQATFTGPGSLTPGAFATVTFQFERSGQKSVQAPVVASTGIYASITPAANGSASPAGSASATASPSGSASPASPAARKNEPTPAATPR